MRKRQRGARKGKCAPQRAVSPLLVGGGLLLRRDLGVDALPRLALERPPVGGLAGRLSHQRRGERLLVMQDSPGVVRRCGQSVAVRHGAFFGNNTAQYVIF